ncbi:MAG: dockerin type I repeat-containing protein [Eubacteriales bacterium]|nr:dockerin type I repeat-containing protein [Eubacteriales bacterium]
MKKRKTFAAKLFAMLLALCVTMACLPVSVSAADENTASISVTFRQGSEENGWIEVKNGTDWDLYVGPGYQNAEAVRIRCVTDYRVDWTGISLRVNGTDILTDDIRNQLTDENGYALTARTEYALEDVEFRQDDGGHNPGPGPEPGDEPVHGGYEGEWKTSSFTIAGKADFYINDSRMVNGNDGDSFDDVSYTYDGQGYVDFYFNCFIGERIYELKVNGVDYYDDLPKPGTEEGREALLDACKGQLNEFKITVPYSESGYIIDSSVKWLDNEDKDYMVAGNFLWTYTDENQGDDYIDHGRMELLQVEYKGTVYSPEELNNPGTAMDWGQDENGGGAVLPVGSVVTVKLIPDYGYQLTSFGINGGDFVTGDEQSVFTFEIKPGNAHLGAHFTPVEDKMISSSDTVTGGSIELGSGMTGGSAQLEISDAENELNDEKIRAFEAAADNYTITDYLNLDLYNVYYKGSTDADDVWKNEVNTLENDATVSVSLADSPISDTANISDIVIIHNIHNGEDFETIPVESYDPETNTITFRTDSFSTYAIATNGFAYKLGDADLDGKINIKDATLIQKHAANLETLDEYGMLAADVTLDSKVNVIDATNIQKFVANIPTLFEIGKQCTAILKI